MGPSRTIRATEITAAVADVMVTCQHGTPTAAGAPVPTVDLQLYFNTDVTVRTSGAVAEALLLVDDPAPQNQQVCPGDPVSCGWTGGAKGANVFQGKVLGRSAIAFQGVPLDPPGDGKSRTFRMTNLRVDASGLSPQVISGGQVLASVTMTGPNSVSGTLLVADVQPPISTTVLETTGRFPLNATGGLWLQNCTSVSQRALGVLQFTALLGGTFRTRTNSVFVDTETVPPPVAQNVAGLLSGSESMFFAPAFPAVNRLNTAGLADAGTRLRAVFPDVPPGVTLYVSTVPVTYTNGVPAVNGAGQFQARLVTTENGVFVPAAPTTTIGGIPVAALAVNQGTAVAVWEVLASNGLAGEKAQFALWLSFTASSAVAGTSTVQLQLGPVSSVRSADDVASIPRFVDDGAALNLFTVGPACTGGAYVVRPYTPIFTNFEVDGIRYNTSAYFNWQPGSTHTLKGILPPQTTDPTRRQRIVWSDGGAPTHTITVPAAPTTYVVDVPTDYQLDLAVIPAGGGSIQASPVSADGFYPSGNNSQVTLQAVPSPGYTFVGFAGDLSGTQSPQQVTMQAARKVNAIFARNGKTPVVPALAESFMSGAWVTLKASFQAAQGYRSISAVQVLSAAAPDGGGAPFCFIHYDVAGGAFWLYSDVYGFFMGPVKPGVASSELQGSACALGTAQSSVQASGQMLELTLAVTSKIAAERNVYLRAMETDASDTGWVRQGRWVQGAPVESHLSAYPNFGAGSQQTFSLSISGAGAIGDFDKGWAQFLVAADSTGGGQPFCFVHYDKAGHQLWMYSSDVGFFLGPVAPQVASAQLNSSACWLDTLASVATPQSSGLNLTLPLTMKAPMRGLKKLYMRTLDALGIDSGWRQVGTYMVP
ncbi:InlB B-repeat-containing protein [Paludibaculum fermentans]|uniref:InlB B-repeat-containing protein n=1 Tax=Paludibaculum fermentans TaxID=1473598 RepID=UPI003EBF7237